MHHALLSLERAKSKLENLNKDSSVTISLYAYMDIGGGMERVTDYSGLTTCQEVVDDLIANPNGDGSPPTQNSLDGWKVELSIGENK